MKTLRPIDDSKFAEKRFCFSYDASDIPVCDLGNHHRFQCGSVPD
jgi:hypothetical protein